MSIKSNLEKHTVNWLKSQDEGEKLNKNLSIQRKEVWDQEKKSNLIISLLLDIPIESLLFEEASNEVMNVLDGKQRTLTLCAFLNDKFTLSPKIRIKAIDGTELVGATFSSLPEALKRKLTEYELSISILRPLETEERATVFFMRNQASPLNKMDLSLVMLGEEAMIALDTLCNHRFMLKKIKLTEPARRKHTDLQVVLQYMILRLRPEIGFSGTEIMNFCDDIKNGEVEIPGDEITELLNYLDAALPEKRQYLKKVHIPVVFLAAQVAKETGIAAESFGRRIDAFFDDLENRPDYAATYGSGSSKRTNVQARAKILCESILAGEPKIIQSEANEQSVSEEIETVGEAQAPDDDNNTDVKKKKDKK
jgi:hypothetical protein